ncbi:Fur family transcriptional regulator [Bacterioplanoides sp. SCSIO 12839]|uniref:Fur family transcriptional regulator n=1 Tax=Bacterioplanoides sp. SCSIO 12839 TaxID=2829569 RepID=UPI002104F81E|nr:Fur family transcriptional regulator [Bacterioplanoides sp. SCSIO 12839]UTW48373.1 transcriptional repressor [Bacterioplanoides sp. SCSIO 12839]
MTTKSPAETDHPANVYAPHDHHACVDSAVQTAKQLCASEGARLTPIRQRVLELVWQSHKPVGAYDLLPTLAQEGFNSAPPTVYRALDFLLELGLVHRINSLNAFVGCSHPGESHPSCFFVCNQCGEAQELHASQIDQVSAQVEAMLGVKVQQQTTELMGLCPRCQA